MKCENKFCIYNNGNICISSDTISLDDIGMCSEQIYINLDKDILNLEKEKILNSYK